MASLPEWNDLRIFLAVARLGTISLAGERLGIEHSTVSAGSTGLRVTEVDYSLYCSPEYRDAHPPIRQLSDTAQHNFVDYIHDGSLSGQFRIVEEITPQPTRSFTSATILAPQPLAD